MINLLSALAQAKSQIKPVQKSQKNGYGNFSYATLSDILSSVEPVLLKNGLVITFSTADDNLICTLWHVASAEKMETVSDLNQYLESNHKKMNKAQLMGAAITYAKKAALCNLLSLSYQEDDPDSWGAAKEDTINTVDTVATVAKEDTDTISKEDLQAIKALMRDKEIPAPAALAIARTVCKRRLKDSTEIKKSQLAEVIAALEKNFAK